MNNLAEYIGKQKDLLNIYFTAGFPELPDTEKILNALESSGAHLIEIGIPFSDPVADGPVIQQSNSIALHNGMNLKLLLQQIKNYHSERKDSSIYKPKILMGYLNSIESYGLEPFCRDAQSAGISGIILPDLPIEEYKSTYQKYFEKYQLASIFLITPETADERILEIDQLTSGFIYAVSTFTTTGAPINLAHQQEYLKRIAALPLKNKILIGFGIRSHQDYKMATTYAQGAIVGSAYIQAIAQSENIFDTTQEFINSILFN